MIRIPSIRRCIVLASIVIALATTAHAQGITMFEGSWSDVVAEAQRTGKPIYLDAYASWCGPCKMLKRDVFPDAEVGAFYNANFINYSLDMEKGEGVELARRFGVSAYPTHLYFDANGNLTHRAVGANVMPAFRDEFIKWGKSARDPNTQLYTRLKRFNAGERDAEFLFALALDADEAYMPEAKAVARAYFDLLSDEQLLNPNIWDAVGKLVSDVRSREFQLIVKNREKLGAIHGQSEVDARILGIATAALAESRRTIETAKKVGKMLGDGLAAARTPEEIVEAAEAYLRFYELTEQWDAYATTAVRYIEEGKVDNPSALNAVAWSFYEHVDDRAMLAKAVEWAERAMRLDESYAIADTYAAVLYKSGRKKEALEAAERAIELAKKDGTDYAETEALLGRIRTEL